MIISAGYRLLFADFFSVKPFSFRRILPSFSRVSTTVQLPRSKRSEKIDENYIRMVRSILNKTWKKHPTKQQLYGHLPFISQTIQVIRTKNVGHCWWSKVELISNVHLWTITHGHTSLGWRPGTYKYQLCADSGCRLEDIPRGMTDRDG